MEILGGFLHGRKIECQTSQAGASEPSTESECFEETLKKNRERDMRMKMTSAGPHRDDLCFMVNGIDIRKFGSQGQQRTAALSLKLSEIYLVKEKFKITFQKQRLWNEVLKIEKHYRL